MDEREGRIEATKRYGMARAEYEWRQLDSLLRFGRALADPMRIRIMGHLARRSMYGQELAEALGVSAPTISHHIALLRAADLVRSKREHSYQRYELNPEALHRLADALTIEHLRELDISRAVAAPASSLPDDVDRKMIEEAHFQDGRLLSMPGHSRIERFIMEKIAQSFEWGRIYDEKEVNAILKTIYDDTATLRRKLIDLKLMEREHGRYWLTRPPL